jgi:tRNA_anti-like
VNRLKRFALAAAAVVVAVIAGWAIYDAVILPNLPKGIPVNLAVAEVKAEDMFNEFTKDPRAANAKYMERFVTVTGKVGEVTPTTEKRIGKVLLKVPSSKKCVEGQYATTAPFSKEAARPKQLLLFVSPTELKGDCVGTVKVS